ncbi:hypothetical protein Y042_5912 [Burkholderia pseudomallei MSHR1357]|nr:hypothetical protein Y042_5912 [Burkholderia pseudomallei MSHR1357]
MHLHCNRPSRDARRGHEPAPPAQPDRALETNGKRSARPLVLHAFTACNALIPHIFGSRIGFLGRAAAGFSQCYHRTKPANIRADRRVHKTPTRR